VNGIGDHDSDFTVKLQRKRKLSAEQVAEMVRRYVAGATLKQLATDYGVTPPAVHYQLAKRVVLRSNQGRTEAGTCVGCSRTLVPQRAWATWSHERRRDHRGTHARQQTRTLCNACRNRLLAREEPESSGVEFTGQWINDGGVMRPAVA